MSQKPFRFFSRAALLLLMMMFTATSAWAENVNVSYINADGTEKTVTATVLTGSETSLGSDDVTTWYVVNSNISYSGTINCFGEVNIILCDDYKMTMNNDNDYCIDGDFYSSLNIYGQTKGTGTLEATSGSLTTIYTGEGITINGGIVNATCTDDSGYAIKTYGNVTINGGIVNATSTDDGGYAIKAYGNVTINGGIVNATCTRNGLGIYSLGTITLGWTKSSDRITASRYDGTVTIAKGKVFEDKATGKCYAVTFTKDELKEIQGHELAPNPDAHTVTIADVEGVTVTADCRAAKVGQTVNVTAAQVTVAGSLIGINYNDGTDHELKLDENGQCTFTMPAANVEVSATKTAAFAEGDGSENNPFLIKSKGDWIDFGSLINSDLTYDINKDKCFKLDNDIEEVTSRIGANNSYVFMGTFDGGGHKLTVDYSATLQVCAPIRFVSDATIKNLHVSGTIHTGKKYTAGIIGQVMKNSAVTIANCRSSVTIRRERRLGGYHERCHTRRQ